MIAIKIKLEYFLYNMLNINIDFIVIEFIY